MVISIQQTFQQNNFNFESKTLNCLQNLLHNFVKSEVNSAEKHKIYNYLVNICQDCFNMAALPQSAFLACKVREDLQKREYLIANYKGVGTKSDAKNINLNKKLTEYSPAKYNDKLMKSIWGLYNRYSPHNIKRNEYESQEPSLFKQQPLAVASHAIAQNFAMVVSATENMWPFKRN